MSGNTIRKNDLIAPISLPIQSNSGYDLIRRSVRGTQVFNTKTLVTAGAPVSTNLFSFTAAMNLNLVFGVVLDNTDIADMTACYFDFWDGTLSVPITAAAGPDLTGFGIGTSIIKDDVVANPAIALDTDQVRIRETAVGTLLAPLKVSPKAGVTNYIRFNYSSASINVTMLFGIIYVCSSLDDCVVRV